LNQLRNYIATLFLSAVFTNAYPQCNNSSLLCDKKYNEIAFLTTHNAFNSAQDNFKFPNQNYGITRQLVDGVRALMIDVYDVDGVPTVYHGKSFLGKQPLSKYLTEIYDFLIHNPNEVVTIIFECYVSANQIQTDLDKAGLLSMAYTKNDSNEWPTLQAMIDSGKRLMVFTDKKDASASQKWYHYIWKYAVETSFEVTDSDDFTTDFNRGSATNDLFILNHFVVNATIGTGVRAKAATVNSKTFLTNRFEKCMSEKTKFPNFVTVDFYDLGNCLSAVNQLNGVQDSVPETVDLNAKPLLYPNPISYKSTVEMPKAARPPFDFAIQTLNGQYITSFKREWESTFTIEKETLPKGIYLLHIIDVNCRVFALKIVVL